MTELSLLRRKYSLSSQSAEVVVAGTRFSTEANTYLVNGTVVSEHVWQERLRGARELQQAVSKICQLYAA